MNFLRRSLRKMLCKKFNFINDYVHMYQYFCSHEIKILRNFYVERDSSFIQSIFKYSGLQQASHVNSSYSFKKKKTSASKKTNEDCRKYCTKRSWVRPLNMCRNHSGAFILIFTPTKYYDRQEFFK